MSVPPGPEPTPLDRLRRSGPDSRPPDGPEGPVPSTAAGHAETGPPPFAPPDFPVPVESPVPPESADPVAGNSAETATDPVVIPVGDRPGSYDHQTPAAGEVVPATGRGHGSFLRELPVLLLIAVVLALLIKQFLVQAFFIPTGSMEQTLHIHDRVLVNKVAYHLRDPHRGEIVVFNTSGTGFAGSGGEFAPCTKANPVVTGIRDVQRFLGVGTCGEDDYIKRIIAVPGDQVQCCDNQGRVVVNGHSLNEPYVYQDNHEAFCAAPPGSIRPAMTFSSCGVGAQPVVVPKGMYWVMGDHRDDSADSRPNGFVPRSKIVGRAFVRILPISRIGFLMVPRTFQHASAVVVDQAGSPLVTVPALAVPLAGLRLSRRRRCRRGARAVAGARRG